MQNKVITLASHSQNYVQKFALVVEVQIHVERKKPLITKRVANPQQLIFDFEDYICPNCQLPFGFDCNGICNKANWMRSSDGF